MLLITRKSECKDRFAGERVISKKQALRNNPLNQYEIRDGFVTRKSGDSYVSRHEIVINGVAITDSLYTRVAR